MRVITKISTCLASGSRLSQGGDLWGVARLSVGGLLFEIEIIVEGEIWCVYALPRAPHSVWSLWSLWRNLTGFLMCRLLVLKCRPPSHQPTRFLRRIFMGIRLMAMVICPYEGSKCPKCCRQLSCEWVTAAKMNISRVYLPGVLLKGIKPTYIPRW